MRLRLLLLVLVLMRKLVYPPKSILLIQTTHFLLHSPTLLPRALPLIFRIVRIRVQHSGIRITPKPLKRPVPLPIRIPLLIALASDDGDDRWFRGDDRALVLDTGVEHRYDVVVELPYVFVMPRRVAHSGAVRAGLGLGLSLGLSVGLGVGVGM
ncbi:hypothetical protein BDZ94DRAFT_1249508 [Collybia nuda]|uniref:Secreted protein n=1 Tax=Collybia nuda TaxID=64659 RepID=A0A9P6CM79_9AGAR|nr:hypothetical protein BDZ94DRAFT_1249508 [Collybia nuda]